MPFLIYVRLIGFTAGTLLQLFWMVVILGYRRQRNFERVFFFLCLALFLFYGGSLLALNAQIYYSEPPAALSAFSIAMISTGLCFLPALVWHLHVEFADTRGLIGGRMRKRIELLLAYAPVPFFAVRAMRTFFVAHGFDFVLPLRSFKVLFVFWLFLALARSGEWQIKLARRAEDKAESFFHWFLGIALGAGGVAVFWLHINPRALAPLTEETLGTILALLPILPLTVLIYLVQRYNFLQIGRQKSLLYAVSATFLALLYLSLVRRVSTWLEPILPPEASAAILLFVLVIFIEPLQRVLGQMLRETAQRELVVVQRLAQEIQEEAKHGDLPRLVTFTEEKIKTTFELPLVKLSLGDEAIVGVGTGKGSQPWAAGFAWNPPYFPILRGDVLLGLLRAEPHGAALSGETRAGLEFLCEQLPGALNLCRLIEEKLLLERELAERERLAALGQMAASISHTLKNPLGSMKTILQLQLESRELPESLKRETRLLLEEIDRLSTKLNQLLRFSRPAAWTGGSGAYCDAREAAEATTAVLRHEAERRGVGLETALPDASLRLAASSEAVHEILSNLVVNALEAAAPNGGHVTLRAAPNGWGVEFCVEDDGAGISPAVRERILQPFFTTKAQGTGLGLAIVARRVAEFGGHLEWESPVANGRGTRFRVWLPARSEEGRKGITK